MELQKLLVRTAGSAYEKKKFKKKIWVVGFDEPNTIYIFSHIWQYAKYESRKYQVPFHIVGNCGNFSSKKQRICGRIFLLQNTFHKKAKICYKKICCAHAMVFTLILLNFKHKLSHLHYTQQYVFISINFKMQ